MMTIYALQLYFAFTLIASYDWRQQWSAFISTFYKSSCRMLIFAYINVSNTQTTEDDPHRLGFKIKIDDRWCLLICYEEYLYAGFSRMKASVTQLQKIFGRCAGQRFAFYFSTSLYKGKCPFNLDLQLHPNTILTLHNL